MPLGPILMRTLSITPLQFGTLVSSYNVSAAGTGILYGVIADKYDRKAMLQLNFVGFILGTIACGFAQNFETLVIARVIAGGFGGTLTSVVMAMVTDLIPFERRGKALGIVMSAFSVASIIGVPIGLLIAESFDWHYTFYFIALFSFFILILSSIIFPPLRSHVKSKSTITMNIKRLLIILFQVDYLKCYFLTFVNVFSIFCLIPYLSPYAVKNIGILETDLKYMYFIGGVCTVIAASFIGKLTDKIGAFRVMTGLIIISFFPIYFYSHAGVMPFSIFLFISAIFMMTVSGRMIPLMTMVSDIVNSDDRGTFMGLMNAIRSLGTALATFFAGFIIVEHSDGSLLGFDKIGIFSILLSFLTIFYVKHIYKILLRVQSERKYS